MLSKKIIIIFLGLVILVLLFGIIFKTVKERVLVENNIGQEGGDLVLESEESLDLENNLEVEENIPELKEDFEFEIVLEAENNLESEELLAEEISTPIISSSSSTTPTTTPETTAAKTSTIKKQMIVVEKEE